MMIRSSLIAQKHAAHAHQSAADLTELEAVRTDPAFTDSGRRERLAAIEGRLLERFDPLLAAASDLVDGAEREYLKRLPSVTQLAAAVEAPDRAADIRRLAEGASADQLAEIAARLAETQDRAAAHGLRSSLLGSELTERDRATIVEVLETIGVDSSEAALTDLVASKWLLARFELAGPVDDPDAGLLRDPAAALAAARAVGVVPIDANGGTRTLPEAELARLLDAAGVQRGGASNPDAA